MDCILKPYLKLFFFQIYKWKEKRERNYKQASMLLASVNRLEHFLKTEYKTKLTHLEYLKSSFQLSKNEVALQIDELYQAYHFSKKCELKSLNKTCNSCSRFISDFYLLCANELFTTSEIQKKNNEWFSEIEKIPKETRMFFTPIDHQIEMHLNTPRETISKQYVKSFRLGKTKKDNFLLVLKSMSSSSPWIYGYSTNKEYNGGGFFLRWQGLGIAIDPGYNFSINLHKLGYSILDIDIVIVTHNHIDHNHDIRILDDLNKSCWKEANHIIKWYIDRFTYDSSCYFLDDYSMLGSSEKCNIITVGKCNQKYNVNDYIKLQLFPTFHMETNSGYRDDTFGVRIEFNDNKNHICKLSYTSDTKYEKSLESNMRGSDIIIANISGIYEDDVKKLNYKKRHLGYYGCINIAENINKNLKLFLLSEFWSGNDDIRFDIAKYMQNELNKVLPNSKTKVFPADIGLLVSLTDFSVKCSRCLKFCNTVFALRPKEDFGQIEYVCNNCLS